jgi:hypothetical protein
MCFFTASLRSPLQLTPDNPAPARTQESSIPCRDSLPSSARHSLRPPTQSMPPLRLFHVKQATQNTGRMCITPGGCASFHVKRSQVMPLH